MLGLSNTNCSNGTLGLLSGSESAEATDRSSSSRTGLGRLGCRNWSTWYVLVLMGYSWLIFLPFIWRLDHSTHNSEWKKDDPLISFQCVQKMLGTSRYRPEPTLPLPAALGCCTTPCATEVADPWCFWCEIGERWPWGISSSQHHSASSNHQPSIHKDVIQPSTGAIGCHGGGRYCRRAPPRRGRKLLSETGLSRCNSIHIDPHG